MTKATRTVVAGRARRGVVAVLVVLVVLVGAAAGGWALWRKAQSVVAGDGCDFGSYKLNLSRSENAATMAAVVLKRGLPERAAVLVIAAALQESKLDNIPAGQGDRDSVGVLQQRPSQGWGTEAQLSDISYATGAFLDALVKVPNWPTETLANAIQEVQVSADGAAYAKHESQATALSDVLLGKTPAGVACDFDKPTDIAAGTTVAARLAADLPVRAPVVNGRVVGVTGASWATAAWFVTHADRYGIDQVSCAGKTWTRSKGWRNDAKAVSTRVSATLAP